MDKVALFPGSFDPFTLGHKVIVDQGLGIFDRIVVGIGANEQKAAEQKANEQNGQKRGLLTIANRKRLIEDIFRNNSRVEVQPYSSLTGEFCRRLGIRFILRGMRNTVDYEYERSIMLVNQKLYPEITTVLLFTPPEYVAISSSIIRELVSFGLDPTELMPNNIDIKNYL